MVIPQLSPPKVAAAVGRGVPRRWTLALGLAFVWLAGPLPAQQVGDRVALNSTQPSGVPAHPAAGDARFVRWANGTEGVIIAFDSVSGWFQVAAAGRDGWFTRRYLTILPEEPEPDPTDPAEQLSHVVGTWNLEWLRDGAGRGFPEYNLGGPRFGPRIDDDYRAIAEVITQTLDARILVLTEINGGPGGRSTELDRLTGFLGVQWTYVIGSTGGSQRVAILFDSTAALAEECRELTIPERRIQNKDIFARDPLVCAFRLLARDRTPMNDLWVVGVHLASGQHLAANHDTAMAVLGQALRQLQGSGAFRTGERDVLIAGDFNASPYDNHREVFWEELGHTPDGWQFTTLAPEDGEAYPPTRLAGNPLFPRSRIDYVMGSGRLAGLVEELVLLEARVHEELLEIGFEEFRRIYSDHLPVTVRIRVVPDGDP